MSRSSGVRRKSAKTPVKRYNLVLPEELFQQLQDLADRRHTTVVELIRKSIKIALLVAEAEESPDKAFTIGEGKQPERIRLL
jgi:hypothetical protein